MEKLKSIAVGTEIEVNDQGDTIICNFGSQEFYAGFKDLVENLEKIQRYVAGSEFKAKSEREQLQIMINKTHDIMHDIDRVFGADTCKKVFGDITPNPFMIADFFDQICPIAEKYTNGRTKELYENTIVVEREIILRFRTMENSMVVRDIDDEVRACIIYCLIHYQSTGMDIL